MLNIINRTKRYVIRKRPRVFQAYSIGAAKTGTTSIASMFYPSYNAAHEPEVEGTTNLVIRSLEGTISDESLRSELKRRDNRLGLEIESAHPLGYLGGCLSELFPDARFIITVRNPFDWIKSRLNFHHAISPPQWQKYRSYFWQHDEESFPKEEQPLQEAGLAPLSVYLNQYSDHYRRVLREIPEERCLIVRTRDISNRSSEIAQFVGANPRKVESAHSKKAKKKVDFTAEVSTPYLKKKIEHHCKNVLDLIKTI